MITKTQTQQDATSITTDTSLRESETGDMGATSTKQQLQRQHRQLHQQQITTTASETIMERTDQESKAVKKVSFKKDSKPAAIESEPKKRPEDSPRRIEVKVEVETEEELRVTVEELPQGQREDQAEVGAWSSKSGESRGGKSSRKVKIRVQKEEEGGRERKDGEPDVMETMLTEEEFEARSDISKLERQTRRKDLRVQFQEQQQQDVQHHHQGVQLQQEEAKLEQSDTSEQQMKLRQQQGGEQSQQQQQQRQIVQQQLQMDAKCITREDKIGGKEEVIGKGRTERVTKEEKKDMERDEQLIATIVQVTSISKKKEEHTEADTKTRRPRKQLQEQEHQPQEVVNVEQGERSQEVQVTTEIVQRSKPDTIQESKSKDEAEISFDGVKKKEKQEAVSVTKKLGKERKEPEKVKLKPEQAKATPDDLPESDTRRAVKKSRLVKQAKFEEIKLSEEASVKEPEYEELLTLPQPTGDDEKKEGRSAADDVTKRDSHSQVKAAKMAATRDDLESTVTKKFARRTVIQSQGEKDVEISLKKLSLGEEKEAGLAVTISTTAATTSASTNTMATTHATTSTTVTTKTVTSTTDTPTPKLKSETKQQQQQQQQKLTDSKQQQHSTHDQPSQVNTFAHIIHHLQRLHF